MKSKIIKPLGLQLEKCLKHLDQFEPKVEARIWKNVNGSSLTKIKTYLSKVEAQITDSSSNSSDSESSSSDEVPVLKKKKEKKGKSQEETNLEESRALAQRLQEEENQRLPPPPQDCLICGEKTEEKIPECQHPMHISGCLASWVSICIESKNFPIKCPDQECTSKELTQGIIEHSLIVDNKSELFQKYQ